MGSDPLRKIRPLYELIKDKCSMLYQPLQDLSIDERMVKSKARCHLVQYMKNKPVKWGFKYWVVADTTGYTVDFDLYTGKQADRSEFGLSYDVMNLSRPFSFQGYRLYVDNFYSSPRLFEDLLGWGITATGTLRMNRTGVPDEVKQLKSVLEKKTVHRGSGYYIRKEGARIVCLLA